MSPVRSHTMVIQHPEPPPKSPVPVRPVFLPFAGCPYRCIYCAQDIQTGVLNSAAAPEALRRELADELNARQEPVELAFYGGTFTALPEPLLRGYLEIASELRRSGLVTRIRCSTRPDCLNPADLDRLARSGVDMVEVGVQSFDNAVLAASGRGYDGATARRGCQAVRGAGMELGVQLLPGLPRMTQDIFADDTAAAAALEPAAVRLYPLLVLEGTPLAARWRAGDYEPWSEDLAVDALADSYLTFWKHGVRVIRAGLAPEAGLDAAFLAGPRHPAMGQRARSLALFRLLEPALAAFDGPVHLDYPRRYQGELWGHRNELAPAYAALGLSRDHARPHSSPWDAGRFVLSLLADSAAAR
ncbi:MAG: elongator complex protein 3 [Oceanidesulfovibrio sp.]